MDRPLSRRSYVVTTYNPNADELKEWRGPEGGAIWADGADIRRSAAEGDEIVWEAEKGNAQIGDLVWIRIKREDEYQAVAEVTEVRVGGQAQRYRLRFLPEPSAALRNHPLAYGDLQKQSHGFMRVTNRARERALINWIRKYVEQ